MVDYPIPPGAENPEPDVVRAVPAASQIAEEKPSFLRRVWNFFAGTTKAVASFTGRTAGTVFGYASYVVGTAYNYTLKPLLDFVERYVPFAGQIRSASRIWFVVMLIMGALIGGLMAAEAGLGIFMSLGMVLLGVVLIPWILATNPVLWPAIAIDLWIISGIYTLIDALFAKFSEGKPFFKSWLFLVVPGWAEMLAPAGTVNPITGEVLNEKNIVETTPLTMGAPA